MIKNGRKGFKCILIFMAVLLLLTIWYINNLTDETPDIWCFDEELPPMPGLLQMMEPPEAIKRPPIFFVETSCTSRVAGKIVLNDRQACAVESAALMNPNSDVYVLLISSTIFNISLESQIIKTLLRYSNIHFRHINLLKYTENTILEHWYRTRELHKSPFVRSHTSDILRYLTLWKYGGTYLDLDVVVTTPLENLPQNYAGAEDHLDLAAGVLNFDKDSTGHMFVESCLKDLRDNYRGNDWGANGPGVITRLLKRICTTKKIPDMTPERCKGFTVYPPSTFYTIPWRQWRLFFNETISDEVMAKLNKSKTIHVWNNVSNKEKIIVGSRQPYGLIAAKYCPKIYNQSGKYF